MFCLGVKISFFCVLRFLVLVQCRRLLVHVKLQRVVNAGVDTKAQ